MSESPTRRRGIDRALTPTSPSRSRRDSSWRPSLESSRLDPRASRPSANKGRSSGAEGWRRAGPAAIVPIPRAHVSGLLSPIPTSVGRDRPSAVQERSSCPNPNAIETYRSHSDTRGMPHFGQRPGSEARTSGCMGHTYPVACSSPVVGTASSSVGSSGTLVHGAEHRHDAGPHRADRRGRAASTRKQMFSNVV